MVQMSKTCQNLLFKTIWRLHGTKSNIVRSIEEQNGALLSNQNDILCRWKEYFKVLLNPVTHALLDIQEKVHLGKENAITLAKVFLAVKTLKAGKAAGCDEIWLEILQAMNSGVLWLTHGGLVFWKCTERLANYMAIIPICKKWDRQCKNNWGISIASLLGKGHVKCKQMLWNNWTKKSQNCGKKYKLIFYQSYCFLVIIFDPEKLESQLKAQKTQIIA